jgi:DNA polymerase-3 subunit epsilon
MSPLIDSTLVMIFDTETTGVDVVTDRVVQIGAVYWKGGQRCARPREININPGVPIPIGASQVHNIFDDDVKDCPSFSDIADRFWQHVEQGFEGTRPVLCGYNAISYDVRIMNAEFERHGFAHRIDKESVLDPFCFVAWYHRDWRVRKLEAVAARYGYDLTDAHSATADAEATGAVLSGMLQAGLIPAQLDEALAKQAEIRSVLASEDKRFRYHLYCDRENPEILRMGFGKHVGLLLSDIAPGYLNFCVGKMGDKMTDETKQRLTEQAERGGRPRSLF